MTVLLLSNFYYFSWWTAVARTLNTMLNKSGKSRHPCLVPDPRRNLTSFSLSMMLTVDLPYITYIVLRYIPSVPTFWRGFVFFFLNHKWLLNFVKSFFASIEIHIICTLRWFVDTEPFLHSWEKNPTWLSCMMFLMDCWIWFANILLRIFAFMFISDTGL